MKSRDLPSEKDDGPTAEELVQRYETATAKINDSVVPDTTSHGLGNVAREARHEVKATGYLTHATQAALILELAEAFSDVNRASVVADDAPSNRDMTYAHGEYIVTRAEQRAAFNALLSLMFTVIDSPTDSSPDSPDDESDESDE